ncbi:thioredoxin family protein [Rummeliibacillus pycnus]|uniref:thioredoxin family protein n=1 Tax=Rummeliibacillus pycnus TaxID=101070 RepID=UPI0037C78E87
MKTEQQYFKEGLPIKDYMEQMTALKEESFNVYSNFQLPQDEHFLSLLNEKKPHILAITEDWCGDAMMNNPIIRRIAEEADLEVRAVFRDQNLELIDQYLTNGGRSIPVYLFLNDEGNVIGKWGPRAPQLQEYVLKKKSELPAQDDPTFADKQKALFAGITEENATNEQFWGWVYEDISRALILALS